MRFELEHLESYDDEALLAELRRVAALIQTPKMTIGQFTALAKVHGSTLQKRFGGWKGALEAAALGDRFDDTSLRKSREEILGAIKATASKLQKDVLTRQEFAAHTGITDRPVRRIGKWLLRPPASVSLRWGNVTQMKSASKTCFRCGPITVARLSTMTSAR